MVHFVKQCLPLRSNLRIRKFRAEPARMRNNGAGMIRAGLALNDEGKSQYSNDRISSAVDFSSFRFRHSFELQRRPARTIVIVISWARTQDSAPGVFRSPEPMRPFARHSLPPVRA